MNGHQLSDIFARQHAISMRAKQVSAEQYIAATGLEADSPFSTYWRCTLRHNRNGRQRQMTIYYRHPSYEAPTVYQVLHTLAYDMQGLDQTPLFWDWFKAQGWELDLDLPAWSPKQPAARVYNYLRRNRRKLIAFLGLDTAQHLMWLYSSLAY